MNEWFAFSQSFLKFRWTLFFRLSKHGLNCIMNEKYEFVQCVCMVCSWVNQILITYRSNEKKRFHFKSSYSTLVHILRFAYGSPIYNYIIEHERPQRWWEIYRFIYKIANNVVVVAIWMESMYLCVYMFNLV